MTAPERRAAPRRPRTRQRRLATGCRILLALLGAGLLLRVGLSIWSDAFNRLLADDLLYVQQADGVA